MKTPGRQRHLPALADALWTCSCSEHGTWTGTCERTTCERTLRGWVGRYYGGTPVRRRKTACFEALVLEPHFAESCARFLLLYCILGGRVRCKHPFIGTEFAASILSLEDAKCEIASLSNTCGLHMFKQWSNLLSRPVKQGNKVSLWGHSENRGDDGVPRAPLKQC